MNQVLLLAFSLAAVMGFPALSLAQATFHIAAGLTAADLRLPKSTSFGASILFGGGINLGAHISLLGEFADATVFRSQPAVAISTPSSSVRLSSITFDPKVRMPLKDNVQMYVIGGYGLYQSHNVVLAGKSSGKGFNAGGGAEFAINESLSLFCEIRVHRAFTTGQAITIIPVSFGIRWH